MDYYDTSMVAQKLSYADLFIALKQAFLSNLTVPKRSHFDLDPSRPDTQTLLTMPAWHIGNYLGIKLITVVPDNPSRDLPTVQGTYQLFDATSGEPIALMDAPELTARRTAATSALASRYLSRADSKTLLIAGTGKLAPYFAEAHSKTRPIERILIWGRSFEKAKKAALDIDIDGISIKAVNSLRDAVAQADIITTITTAKHPFIKGEWIKPGVHLDLVGAYRPDMREVDSDTVAKASLFVDTMEGALAEAGDLIQPLQEDRISSHSIRAELKDLLSLNHPGRKSDSEITLFKSVGCAVADYAAAMIVANKEIR